LEADKMKISALMAGLVLLAQSLSMAFTLNSSNDPSLRGWASPDVQFLLNPTNCPAGVDVAEIVTAAASVWNNLPQSNVKVSYGGTTTSTTYSSSPTVYCETNFQSVTGGDSNSVPGVGGVQASGGQITSGILILNASGGRANIASYNSTVLSIILAHEIGHVLGLGHSEYSYALMYFDASAKTTLTLAQDDMDGMSYLYPRDELGKDKMMGCGLIHRGSQNNFPGPKAYLLLIVLLVTPILLSLSLRGRPQPKMTV
jgi:hypothetical protein